MNKENMLKLAAVIEPLPINNTFYSEPETPKFCMSYVVFDCGTPACIAGWAASCATGRSILNGTPIISTAAAWLDVPGGWAHSNLFYPDMAMEHLFNDYNYDRVTPKVAAALLRELASKDKLPDGDEMLDVWAEAFKKGAE